MKKLLLTTLSIATSTLMFAQGQIGNSDMEQWEAATPGNGEEPVNWNSFETASGSLNGLSAVQVEQSSDVRPGSTGTKSARIWSRDAGFSIIANGNLTVGQVNMGSIQATSIDNHNWSNTSDPNFSEALTDEPDSIVFWAKFVLGSTTQGNARMKATLHDNFEYQDPEEPGVDGMHVRASAVINFPATNGWQRFSVPFTYNGPASSNSFILVTFATNETPGVGNVNDQVWIDDVELIYNPVGIDEENLTTIKVAMNNSSNTINIISSESLNGEYEVYNLMGQRVQTGSLISEIEFNQPAGMYIVKIQQNGQTQNFEIVRL